MPIILARDWYELVVSEGVCKERPGIYEWRIEGKGTYIGKFGRIRRPLKEYGRNITRLLNNRPYRKGKPEGFRWIHRVLAEAVQEKRRITLTILENVSSSESISASGS